MRVTYNGDMTEPVRVAGIGAIVVAATIWVAALIRDKAAFEDSLTGNWIHASQASKLHIRPDGSYRLESGTTTIDKQWHTDGKEVVLEGFSEGQPVRLHMSPAGVILSEGHSTGHTFRRIED